MSYTNQFNETCSLLYNLAPISQGAGVEQFTSYVSLANYHRAAIVIHTGVMAGGSTLDAVVHQATTTAGGGPAKHLTPSKAITQLTQAGADSNKDVLIEIQTEELDVDNGFDCIALGYTVGAAATLLSIEIYGLEPRFAPVATTAWDEIV